MTQEEKQLLLKEFCTRLPYKPICEDIYGNSGILFDLIHELNAVTLKISKLGSTWTTDIENVKLYLRPLSSMTEEEDNEWQLYKGRIVESCDELLEKRIAELHDWFCKKHLDYRGLIEMGLALPASKEMYK